MSEDDVKTALDNAGEVSAEDRFQPEVERLSADRQQGQGSCLSFDEPEPWPDPVDGAQLLVELSAAIRRYLSMLEATAEVES
jgi:hypothetical protein